MSVERVAYYQKYIGLSSDEKPIVDESVDISLLPGAEFYETDTNNSYVWNGTEWKLKSFSITQIEAHYAIRLENTDAAPTKITYIGEALPGSANGDPVWRIRKVTETDHPGWDPDITVEWVNGSDAFTSIWNGHAGYTYS